MSHSPSIQSVIDTYTGQRIAQKPSTGYTYKQALLRFSASLLSHGLDPADSPIESLGEESILWLLEDTEYAAVATERLYLYTVMGLFKFIEAEGYKSVNLTKLRYIIEVRARKQGQRLPNFNIDNVEKLLAYASGLHRLILTGEPIEYLINLRDRALILTLADTGLRIHEACKLLRGDIDYKSGKAIIIGKGDKQDIVHFSTRSLEAIKEYLAERTKAMDGKSGKPLSSLAIFARHDRAAGKRIQAISITTGWNIVHDRAVEALGEEYVDIHPHSLRHYFVTKVLATTHNLKLAQDLARHTNMQVTQRYAHLTDTELDEGYNSVFNK